MKKSYFLVVPCNTASGFKTNKVYRFIAFVVATLLLWNNITNAQCSSVPIMTTHPYHYYFGLGMKFDAGGNFFINDIGYVTKVDPSGIATTIAGVGTLGFSGDGGPATAANIHGTFMAGDASGNLFLADSSGRIRKINTSTGIITTIAGTGTYGYSGDGSAATLANIRPDCMTADASGNIYFADRTSHRIRKISTGGTITTIAGNGTSGYSGDGGAASAAMISTPNSIAMDPSGNIIFGDGGSGIFNDYIRKITPSGIISRVAGGGTSDSDGIAATAASVAGLTSLTTDVAGNIYLGGFYKVKKINLAGFISTYAGTDSYSLLGTIMYSYHIPPGTGDGLRAISGGFEESDYLATDADTNLYICDRWTGIRKVSRDLTPIFGVLYACVGGTSTLTNPTAGGVWSSSNPAVASVGSSSGIVSGITGGTTNITYTAGSCTTVRTFTVYALPASITGAVSLCTGSSATLSSSPAGGVWASSNTTLATITTYPGVVTGLAPGIDTISYTYSIAGCRRTTTLNVVTGVAPITGPTGFCNGTSIILSNTTPGGTWSSSTPSVAPVGVTTGGVVGVSPGTTTITYTIGSTCFATYPVTVFPNPAVISGPGSVCTGSSVLLTNSTTGGTWSSANPTIASIGSSIGNVTGNSAGVTMITYTLSTGCYAVYPITVNSTPAAITGSSALCISSYTTLSSTTTGGTWFSGSVALLTVGSATGIVTALSAGIGTITYIVPSGCYTVKTITVVASPPAISGSLSMCIYSDDTLNNAGTGGVWSSSDVSVATVGSTSGIVYGVYTGTATITYTLGTGCYTTSLLTVDALPSPLTGPSSFCEGANATYIATPPGGSWTIASTAVATIGLSSGIATGVHVGTTIITYTITSYCRLTKPVTVTAGPAPISGVSGLCAGSSTTMTDITPGGVWSSTVPAVGTISTTGVLNAIATGTITVVYTTTGGCAASKVVTVYATPPTITGPTSVCAGSNITLSNTTTGGVWTSSSPSTASINATTGVVTGNSSGTATMTYTLGSGCYVTKFIIVNPSPTPFSGSPTVCTGATTTWSTSPTGGTWSIAPTTVGSISGGVITGISPGTATVTYSLGTGCSVSGVITVNPSPAPVGGGPVCQGASITFSSATTGGTWSTLAPSIAVINTLTGLLTGISAGSTFVIYTLPNGCTATSFANVSPVPPAISGSSAICTGSSTTFSDALIGGSWHSSNAAVAAVGASTGLVTGISAGTATISYVMGTTGCYTTKSITINLSPSAIGGPSAVCEGTNISLTNTIAGGYWTSSDTSVANIAPFTGIVNGVSAGITTITYSLGSSCFVTMPLTVNPVPGPISGLTTICSGSTTTLTDGGGGVWTSASTGVATIGTSSGFVSAIATGTSIISYILSTGCSTSVTITVSTTPPAISGPTSVCPGATITLTNSGGGIWSSGTTSVATIGSLTGIVTGVAPGTTTITYSLGSGCTVSVVVTVNALPAGITGTASVCEGSSTTLSSTAGGGIWSSSSSGIAFAGSASGVINGVSSGFATITYTQGSGCYTTIALTVNPMPTSISGPGSVCSGSTITLTDATSGGVWSSLSSSVATIGTSSGIVSGLVSGTTSINYTLAGGCFVSRIFTVNPSPAAISGPTTVCTGSTITLTDLTSGGTWTSGSASVASIGASTGIVTGLTAGSSTIQYTTGLGCFSSYTISVNTTPSAITGTSTVCEGATTTLASTTSGGNWMSGSTAIATVGSATGIVTGVSAGISNITYSVGSCYVIKIVTVNASPASISGVATLYMGSSITLTDATTGGLWTSNNVTIATAGSGTGIVTGVSGGTTQISYTLGSGCYAVASVTVTGSPAPITGAATVCEGSTTTLSDISVGGVWSSSDVTVATVGSSSGTLSGVAAGTVNISYTISGVSSLFAMTVIPVPAAITGAGSVCSSSSVTLSNTATGGTWSSSSTAIATVGSGSGVVTGVTTGVVTITYSTGCGTDALHSLSVNPTPASGTISGSSTVVTGASTTLTETVSGGVWSSSNTAVVTIGFGTGLVTGIGAGSATISYTITACSISVSDTLHITDLPVNRISGNILFGGTPALSTDTIKVWLITYNTGTLMLEAIDSQIIMASGSSVYYEFLGAPTDSYRVKAAYLPATFTGSGYIPTYHTSHFYWHDADVLYHTGGSDDGLDITMGSGTVLIGPGFISGYVTSGANKGTAGSVAVEGLLVYIKNTSGTILQHAITDTGGAYVFYDLPVGQTYDIYPEAINYATTAYTSILLSADADTVRDINFVQHTVSHTITPTKVYIQEVKFKNASIALFPNPNNGVLNLSWKEPIRENGVVIITDAIGREVYRSDILLTEGTGNYQINLGNLVNGDYLIAIRSGNINYTGKLQLLIGQ